MAEHPIQGLMNVTMDKIRQMADSNTIIGKPIKTDDGTTILPVSRISFGFASAGTDFDGKNAANKDLFGGGSGAGVNIQPGQEGLGELEKDQGAFCLTGECGRRGGCRRCERCHGTESGRCQSAAICLPNR